MKCENTLSTGFQSLDRVLGGGFHGDSLNVIAARPGMGKSVFALQCAVGMVKDTDKKIYIFSLEMSRNHAKEKFKELYSRENILFDDIPAITPNQIHARLAGISDLGAVIIDYFQLLLPNPCEQNAAANTNKVAGELKVIAREFNIPIICTSQLPRTLEKRRDRRPLLRDLAKISGGLEQISDVILFLYRYAYYDTDEINGAEVTVANNRFGRCDVLPFRFEGSIPQFSEE